MRLGPQKDGFYLVPPSPSFSFSLSQIAYSGQASCHVVEDTQAACGGIPVEELSPLTSNQHHLPAACVSTWKADAPVPGRPSDGCSCGQQLEDHEPPGEVAGPWLGVGSTWRMRAKVCEKWGYKERARSYRAFHGHTEECGFSSESHEKPVMNFKQAGDVIRFASLHFRKISLAALQRMDWMKARLEEGRHSPLKGSLRVPRGG